MAADKRYFTKEHDWIKMKEGKAYIGKTEFGIKNLGNMILVDLPSENEDVMEGDEIAFLEGAKDTATIYAPFDGVVAEVNEDLLDRPEMLNKKCETTFILVIYNEDGYDTSSCMNNDEYEDYIYLLGGE
jgi:glycine cleavage system H protein